MGETVSVVVENGKYGVVSSEGIIIVPFGKYDWIETFDNGLARVRTEGIRQNVAFVACDDGVLSGEEYQKRFPEKMCKWGIINEAGEEVLKPVYDGVWKFLGQNRWSTTVEKDGNNSKLDLWSLPGSRHRRPPYYNNGRSTYPNHRSHYGEYAGTYAQDVAGLSDETISDAFEGDPDAYWNID